MEELVAELGAAFLAADLGLEAAPREDHAAYIGSWLKVLKGDKRAIFTAASHAQRAVDFLAGLQLGCAHHRGSGRMSGRDPSREVFSEKGALRPLLICSPASNLFFMSLAADLQAHFRAALDPALDRYSGPDWFQLTRAESEVFGLALDELPALVAASRCSRPSRISPTADFARTPLCAAAQRPCLHPARSASGAWSRFAGLLGIPSRLAFAWFWKHQFWLERQGLITRFDDDIAFPASPAPRSPPPVDDGIPF